MCVSKPFQLTPKDIKQASLKPSDVGLWCVLVKGCYHLFGSESQARFAYEKFTAGVMVR